jgi:hypothetical protein
MRLAASAGQPDCDPDRNRLPLNDLQQLITVSEQVQLGLDEREQCPPGEPESSRKEEPYRKEAPGPAAAV